MTLNSPFYFVHAFICQARNSFDPKPSQPRSYEAFSLVKSRASLMKKTALSVNVETPTGADKTINPHSQLVSAEQLLELIFPPESSPTVRGLRERQKQREIPFVEFGRLVFFPSSAPIFISASPANE